MLSKIKVLWPLYVPAFLKENKRQQGNSTYASLLNRACLGMLESDDINLLQTCLASPDMSTSAICPLQSKCKEINQEALESLQGDVVCLP